MVEIIKGEGKHRVKLEVLDTGNGLVAVLTGGETPHVGGVVLAVPRPSLSGLGNSCDVWSTPVPGHLDNEVAIPMAKSICTNLGRVISLTAGIHIENAGSVDIQIIKENCKLATKEFMQLFK